MAGPGRSKIRTTLLTGVVGLGAVAVVGLGVPALAATTDDETTASQAVGDRLSRLKDALTGLVSDGTLTQAQADKVAETLDEKLPARGDGPGGMGGPGGMRGFGADLTSLADTLGITVDELHTALHDGRTLAEVAKEQGVSTDTVVTAIVKAATERIDQAVADGRITAERATTLKADLEDRVTTWVTEGGPAMGGMGRGPGGMGGMRGHGPHGDLDRDGDDGGATPAPSPSAPVTPENSSLTV